MGSATRKDVATNGGAEGPTMTAADRVRALFSGTFGGSPATIWAAPGRVNLIGEHTDYNDGFVLPFAVHLQTAVAVREADDEVWTVRSDAEDDTVRFGPNDLAPAAVTGWASYVVGVVAVLRQAGVPVPGADLAICSDVPRGAGLSSSAALECAVLAALVELSGATLPRDQWPALARRAENDYAGVPCGILDQAASTLCRNGHALFLDCRDGSTAQIPFDLGASDLAMLIIDTRARHSHAEGEYAARRASCDAAAAALGVPSLRDVDDLATALAGLDDDVLRRRTRHVVTENDRVQQTVALLNGSRPADIGPLLTASHASLRDDFEVSCAELDLAAAEAVRAGALGARMVGGGFGGCVIALVPTGAAAAITDAVVTAFKAAGYQSPTAFAAIPSTGVHRVDSGTGG
jgi:galactokinase